MIEIDSLGFSYGDGREIFSHFSLNIGVGEAWSIIGASGCGKTTLLSLLAGMVFPEQGVIRIGGDELLRPRPRTGLVLQDHGLLPWATIRENTELGLKIRKYYGPDGVHTPQDMENDSNRLTELVDYWLNWLGIIEYQDKYPAEVSRGQRQRAAIARSLVLEPDLLLMDEPFSALDAPIRDELQQVMNSFHQESGLTSITVTHDIDEALVLGEKILVLTNGVNSFPVVFDNDFQGKIDRRNDSEFIDKCNLLRQNIAKSTMSRTQT